MENIDRRTVFAAGLAAASLISNTRASAQQAGGGSAEARLREFGIELPKVPVPVANYVPAARLGNVIFLAETGPIKPDGKLATGKVGIDVTLDEANQHARLVGRVGDRQCGLSERIRAQECGPRRRGFGGGTRRTRVPQGHASARPPPCGPPQRTRKRPTGPSSISPATGSKWAESTGSQRWMRSPR
jgi:hypothetical protein